MFLPSPFFVNDFRAPSSCGKKPTRIPVFSLRPENMTSDEVGTTYHIFFTFSVMTS